MKDMRGMITAFSVLIFSAALTDLAQSQGYPNREIHLYVGYPVGTGADTLARYVAHKLNAKSGQPIIVENKAGANGSIAAQAAARAKPDGYTIILTGTNSHAIAPFLFKNLAFDPVKDFTPLTTIQKLAFGLAVNPQTPVNSVAELTEYLRKKGNTSYGSAATTSLAAGELYKAQQKLDVVRVDYKSTPDAVRDLNAGLIDFVFVDASFGLAQAREGKLRILAVTSGERISVAPEIPTMAESGLPGFDLTPWWGSYGPANLPAPIADKLVGWLNEIVASDETKKFFNTTGAEPFYGNPKVLADLQVVELEKWGKIFKAANIKPE
jgi:tripartite-type tricarboxylate transporter receptor subunit TctC